MPGDDAERLPDRVHVDAGRTCSVKLALEQRRDAARELDHLEAARDLAQRVGEDLAVLGGDQPRELVAVLVDELADAEEELRALRERDRAPGREGRLRGRDGAVDLLDRREVDLGCLLAGGRVEDAAAAARLPGHGPAVDPVADPLHVAWPAARGADATSVIESSLVRDPRVSRQMATVNVSQALGFPESNPFSRAPGAVLRGSERLRHVHRRHLTRYPGATDHEEDSMTELASAPERAKRSRPEADHPLDRRQAVAGESGRSGRVFNPATGEQTGEVDFASIEEVDRAVAAAQDGVPGVARGVALASARSSSSASASSSTSIARISRGCSRPSTARCSPTRWARSPAGSR